MNICYLPPKFSPGEKALVLVSHAPETGPGELVKIVKLWTGNLCAVELPDGKIHRWFAAFELSPDDRFANCPFEPGKSATVISDEGHGSPPHVKVGTRVKIVRCFPTSFYDVYLENGDYHRWLAGFELAKPV